MDRKETSQGPLSSEALKRDEWRGEDEKEAGSSDETKGSERPPEPLSGTMLPPD